MKLCWLVASLVISTLAMFQAQAAGDEFIDAMRESAIARDIADVDTRAARTLETVPLALLEEHQRRERQFEASVAAQAARGNPEAQLALGTRYDAGTSVPQDFSEAARWYRLAAAQGNRKAMERLARKYALGESVSSDLVRAHMWANLAAALPEAQPCRGCSFTTLGGGAATNVAIEYRNVVARFMSSAQISSAQRLARECRASNYQRCGEPGERPATPAPRSRPPKPAG